MPQKLALHLRAVAAEGIDVEVAPRAVAAVRDGEGARAQREHARARVAVHAPLQVLGRQQAQVALARRVGLPVLVNGSARSTSRCT